jgi:tetratricopeptide (TPR) repeat protein
VLETTILVRAGKPSAAYLRIGEIKTHEGRLLGLLAALRANVLAPKLVLARAEALAEETRNKPLLQWQVWALAGEAAARAGESVRRIYALERALTLARLHPAPERLLTARPEDLWQAYARYAEAIGNDKRLLIGQDAKWFKHAESYKRDDAMQARAFYAFLAGRAADPGKRALATRRLADSLIEDGRGEVLRALYTASDRYADLDAVPAYVRYRLTEVALDGYDIAFAGRLVRGLDAAPDGQDEKLWALRRARVLVYSGQYADANRLLAGTLTGSKTLSDELIEKILQVIFDMQAAHRHAEAIALLETLLPVAGNRQTQREILYWIAESRAALGEYQQAAELYLRSASQHHPTGGDMWGQTARYHAAEALGKAGLTQDARLVFQALLKHTEDAKQRAVIERSIQQLWLIEKKATTP